MPRHRSLPDAFTPWPRESGAGFSFRQGDLRGEVQPYRDDHPGALTRWEGILWRGHDRDAVLVRLTADNHWDVAESLSAYAKEI